MLDLICYPLALVIHCQAQGENRWIKLATGIFLLWVLRLVVKNHREFSHKSGSFRNRNIFSLSSNPHDISYTAGLTS